MNDRRIKERDAECRRLIITALKLADDYSPAKGLSGPSLLKQINGNLPWDGEIDSADCQRLIREMARWGYVTAPSVSRGSILKLDDFRLVSITEKGLDLWSEKLPPDPMVKDERIEG